MTNRQESAAALRWFRWVKNRGDCEGGRFKLSCWILKFEATNKQASAAVLWYFKWLKRMAEQGNAEAQYRVGQIFEVGRGGDTAVYVEDADAEAVKWYRKAAKQGDADAQYKLGNMCVSHLSDEDPVKWFRKAAEQGHVDAKGKLVRLLAGRDTDDDVEAYAWYLLAKEDFLVNVNGDEEVSEDISYLEKRLTVEQGKKAQARAVELHRLIKERKENPTPSVESK